MRKPNVDGPSASGDSDRTPQIKRISKKSRSNECVDWHMPGCPSAQLQGAPFKWLCPMEALMQTPIPEITQE